MGAKIGYDPEPENDRLMGRPGFSHLCFHPDHGPHQCHCGIESGHTTAEFKRWHGEIGVPVLDSQVD